MPDQLYCHAKTGQHKLNKMYVTVYTHTYIKIHTQPFVQHHLEKTTIRNQKAKKEKGDL
jgi:hypothetical protein